MATKRIALAAVLGTALLVSSAAAAIPAGAQQSAAARGTYSGTWQGTTSQSRVIKFQIGPANKVYYLAVSYRINGGYCTVTGSTTLRHLSAAINSQHKFVVRHLIGNPTIVVHGTMLSRTKASGTARIVMTDPTGFGCAGSTSPTWRAHKT